MVMCIIVDSLGGTAANTWFLLCVFINLADLFIYTGVWVLIRFKASTNDSMRKVFRSLQVCTLILKCIIFNFQVIMFSVAAGWLINALMVRIEGIRVHLKVFFLS